MFDYIKRSTVTEWLSLNTVKHDSPFQLCPVTAFGFSTAFHVFSNVRLVRNNYVGNYYYNVRSVHFH